MFAVLLYACHVTKLPFSFPVLDGESPLQKYPCKREGDADLLHLHGEEQQEPPGPERRRWRQTAGLKLLMRQQQSQKLGHTQQQQLLLLHTSPNTPHLYPQTPSVLRGQSSNTEQQDRLRTVLCRVPSRLWRTGTGSTDLTPPQCHLSICTKEKRLISNECNVQYICLKI